MQQDINALLQAIYDDYQKPLRILALSLGVPEKDVDDIVQESIIAYYQHYPLDWQPRYKKSMLATIVRNKSIDYFRKYQREHVIWDSEYFLENQEISARYGDDLMDQIICEELYLPGQNIQSKKTFKTVFGTEVWLVSVLRPRMSAQADGLPGLLPAKLSIRETMVSTALFNCVCSIA